VEVPSPPGFALPQSCPEVESIKCLRRCLRFFTGLGGNQRTEAESRFSSPPGFALPQPCPEVENLKCLRRCLRFSRDSAAISVLKLNIYPQLSVVFMAPPFRAGGYFHFSPIRSLNLGCSISPSSSYERNILISSISAISSFSRNIVAGL